MSNETTLTENKLDFIKVVNEDTDSAKVDQSVFKKSTAEKSLLKERKAEYKLFKKTQRMRKTIYIAGGITGLPDDNITAFYDANAHLVNEGHNVFNPHEICKHLKRADYVSDLCFWLACMRENEKFLKMAGTIYLLKGWETSRGARHELKTAIENNLEIIIQ